MSWCWCWGWGRHAHVVEIVEVTADKLELCAACWTRRETEGPWI